MKHNSILFVSLMLLSLTSAGQSKINPSFEKVDSTKSTLLQEVVIIAKPSIQNGQSKILATVDQYLESSDKINMIKRGAYAWEPMLNGMSQERGVITIDGMRVYNACTDKMDPVTSYVETTNLSRVEVISGQHGAENGATVAGSINLASSTPEFGSKNISGYILGGYESNNRQRIVGGKLQYVNPKYYSNISITSREADNYEGGGGKEILYSQFSKINFASSIGRKLKNGHELSANVIYDRATDIGYPALPMDASLAKALITSVEHTYHVDNTFLNHWNTKIYYNTITHYMDDSKRPIVPIRMVMPGWSKTFGFYSNLSGQFNKHQWKFNTSGHWNNSLASMTMFSNNPDQEDMYMLTWPNINTLYAGVFVHDDFIVSEKWKIISSAGIGYQLNTIKSEMGLGSLSIFYPGIQSDKSRWLKSIATTLQFSPGRLFFSMGMGYGERAPSISEGYGYYLFNSFDKFDYIGNPQMHNERSYELNASAGLRYERIKATIQGSLFYFKDYIIGRVDNNLSAMTIGAAGVKVYDQLPFATIINFSANVQYMIMPSLNFLTNITYRRGEGSHDEDLPLIQPLVYKMRSTFRHNKFTGDFSLEGAGKQIHYNSKYGENAVSDYLILNFTLSKSVKIKQNAILTKAGMENILDKRYVTFADWNRIPRMGRNFFINLIYYFS